MISKVTFNTNLCTNAYYLSMIKQYAQVRKYVLLKDIFSTETQGMEQCQVHLNAYNQCSNDVVIQRCLVYKTKD